MQKAKIYKKYTHGFPYYSEITIVTFENNGLSISESNTAIPLRIRIKKIALTTTYVATLWNLFSPLPSNPRF